VKIPYVFHKYATAGLEPARRFQPRILGPRNNTGILPVSSSVTSFVISCAFGCEATRVKDIERDVAKNLHVIKLREETLTEGTSEALLPLHERPVPVQPRMSYNLGV
jgi:hypothetical protein